MSKYELSANIEKYKLNQYISPIEIESLFNHLMIKKVSHEDSSPWLSKLPKDYIEVDNLIQKVQELEIQDYNKKNNKLEEFLVEQIKKKRQDVDLFDLTLSPSSLSRNISLDELNDNNDNIPTKEFLLTKTTPHEINETIQHILTNSNSKSSDANLARKLQLVITSNDDIPFFEMREKELKRLYEAHDRLIEMSQDDSLIHRRQELMKTKHIPQMETMKPKDSIELYSDYYQSLRQSNGSTINDHSHDLNESKDTINTSLDMPMSMNNETFEPQSSIHFKSLATNTTSKELDIFNQKQLSPRITKPQLSRSIRHLVSDQTKAGISMGYEDEDLGIQRSQSSSSDYFPLIRSGGPISDASKDYHLRQERLKARFARTQSHLKNMNESQELKELNDKLLDIQKCAFRNSSLIRYSEQSLEVGMHSYKKLSHSLNYRPHFDQSDKIIWNSQILIQNDEPEDRDFKTTTKTSYI